MDETGQVPRTGRPKFDAPPVDRSVLDVFHGPDESRAWASASQGDRQVLLDLGWVDAEGELSGLARSVRRDLRERSVTFAISATDTEGELHGTVITGSRHALAFVEAQPRPWGWGNRPVTHQVRFTVIDAGAVPIFLGRWAGLSPVLGGDMVLEDLDADLLEARLRDPETAPPPAAGEAMSRLWGNPWVLWTVSCPAREIWLNYLDGGDCGQFLLREGRAGRVRLVARPGSLVWGELLQAHQDTSNGSDAWPAW